LLFLTNLVGPTLPLIALTASTLYGMSSFSERDTISQISTGENGMITLQV